MTGFLRKFATRKSPGVPQNFSPPSPVPSKPVDDAPPSLPPLFARFATSSLEEQDIFSSYISSPTPLVKSIQDPIPNHILPESDTCNPPLDPSPVPPPPDVHPPRHRDPPLPAARRRYTGPGLPPKQVKLSHNNNAADTYSSSSSPRTIHVVPTRQQPNQQHSISATPPIIVSSSPRPLSPARPSSHSQDNQVPSYTPPASRVLPPLLPLQNPPSSSSLTSSSSNHSDATRISTAFTSTSSIAPAIKQIDVTNVETYQGRSSSRLRLARPNPFNPRSSANLNNPDINANSSTGVRSHSPSIHRTLPSPGPPSRNLTHTTTTPTTRSPAVPPTMPPRQNALPLAARPLTHADATSYRQSPLQPIHARAVSVEVSTPPVRKGPLIFATMASINPLDNSVGLNLDSKLSVTTAQAPARRTVHHDDPRAREYPSPPAEYASLDLPGTRHVSSLSSSSGHGRVSSETGRISSVHEHGQPSSETGRMSSEARPMSSALPVRKPSRAGTMERVPETQNSRPRTLTKPPRSRSRSRPPTPSSASSSPPKLPQNLSSEPLFSGDALFFDADPFAKVEGVQVVKTHAVPSSAPSKTEGGADEPAPVVPSTPPTRPKSPLTPESPEEYKAARTHRRGLWLEKTRPPVAADANVQQEVMSKEAELLQLEEEARLRKEEEKLQKEEEERRVEEERLRLEEEERQLEEQRQEAEEKERLRREATVYPIVQHLSDVSLLPHLVTYLTFSDWCSLYGATKEIRGLFESRVLREYVLEHFLGTVGYSSWKFEWAEPLALSLKDLNDYMRGVSMPTYQYAQLAEAYLHPQIVNQGDTIPQVPDILSLAITTRAYNRVVLRLRAQAESEARAVARAHINPVSSLSRPTSRAGSRDKQAQAVVSRVSSRAPSPASSHSNSLSKPSGSSSRTTFRSPLVKLHRAPLLRVFVPSPGGEWLTTSSVEECEAELKRAGVLKLLRVGDVVWDVAVGDEGNLGRMVWDGSYLVDLDYKYSRMGELASYFHSLAFSPSYFHRVIRTGVHAAMNPDGNPIVYIDVRPWGKELATNLQLLQDRVMTTTPHGTLHSVMRWVHRSSFTIRPPVSPHHPHAYSHLQNLRLPIPNVDGFFIDPGWYGTVVVEVEGTNEGLADLQDRCGPGSFPPRADNITSKMKSEKEKDSRRVFRVLREKSRPGEIWIRAVREKERVM